MSNPYLVIAYYHFTEILNPLEEVSIHKNFLEKLDIKSRIYISENGINAQMSALKEDGETYLSWVKDRYQTDIFFKIQEHHEHVFPRLTVKYRKQLVALDAEVDLSLRGEYVEPQRWKQMLDDQNKKVLLDVRNDYEWKVGHFEGAELPQCATFRDFNNYADQLKKEVDPEETPVMMYCTAGIRCELYSAVLKSKGFEKVYQLHGGIVNYGQKQGSDHWLGKVFVFDDRLAVPISEGQETPVVGKCHHCGIENETYYNCANMDCNELFLCCPECVPKFVGCCQEACMHAERLRPYQHVNPKPFRKWYHYEKKS